MTPINKLLVRMISYVDELATRVAAYTMRKELEIEIEKARIRKALDEDLGIENDVWMDEAAWYEEGDLGDFPPIDERWETWRLQDPDGNDDR